MDPVTIGLMAAGTVVSIYGTLKSAKDEKRHRKLQAQLAEQEASEILLRNEINSKIMYRDMGLLLGKQRTAIAGAGMDVGGVTAMELANEVMISTTMSVNNMTREAQFNAAFTRAGGASQLAAGDAAMKSARYQALGTLITGGAGAYKEGMMGNTKKPTVTNPDDYAR